MTNDHNNRLQPEPDISDRDLLLLSGWIDDVLEPDERAEIQARLEQDAGLRRELDALQRTVTAIQDLPVLRAPRDFTLPLDTQRPAVTEKPKLVSMPKRRNNTGTFWLSAAATLTIVLVGFAVLANVNQQGGLNTGDNMQIAFASTPTEDFAASRMMTSPETANAELYAQTEVNDVAVNPDLALPGESTSNRGQQSGGDGLGGVGSGGQMGGGADAPAPNVAPPDEDEAPMVLIAPPTPQATADAVSNLGAPTDIAQAAVMQESRMADEQELDEASEESTEAEAADMAMMAPPPVDEDGATADDDTTELNVTGATAQKSDLWLAQFIEELLNTLRQLLGN